MKNNPTKSTNTSHFIVALLAVYFSLSLVVVLRSYVHSVEAINLPRTQEKTQQIKEGSQPQEVVVKELVEEQPESSVATKDKPLTLWQEPTDGPYPKLTNESDVRINVNLTEQKLYLYDHEKLVYTMIISSGLADEENQTPTGTFEIQNVRGESFFNQALDEGALNYVSFKDYGVYLFHSVPVNQALEVNVPEAEKLGKKASHGCIRLSMPDSKWFYDTIQVGTPVKIVN